MIKVGQVYEMPITRGRFVVCEIEQNKKDHNLDWVYFLFPCGYKDRIWRKGLEEMKLIAEYPTLDEAIKIQEFNEVGNESKQG